MSLLKRDKVITLITAYLAIQMVHTSLGPCLRGHNTWACLNVSLEFAFSSEVRLNFDVAVFDGTLKSLDWCVNCQLAEFTQRGLRMRSSPTLPPVWSLFSFWGDKRELRRLGWEVVLGDCRVLFCFFSSLGESEIHVRVQIQSCVNHLHWNIAYQRESRRCISRIFCD